MTEEKQLSYLAIVIAAVVAVFMIVQGCIWLGAMDIPELGNLNSKLDAIFENPAFVGLIMTVVVGVISGYMENWVISGEKFDVKKLGETFFLYEPLIILFAQWLPMEYAVVFVFSIDVLRRIFKIFRTQSET